ncbi:MAG: restriction endonuclease subunit S [Alphaproteobacteria bacterium]
MSRWPLVPLNEACDQDRKIIPPSDSAVGALPFVGLEQVEAGTGNISLQAGSRTGEGRSTTFRFDARHVLYGKLRPYLNKVALPQFEGRCSTELVPLVPRANVDREYLAYFLRRPAVIHAVMAANTGARMPRADMDLLLRLHLPLPPISEQRRIVDILNRASGIVRLRREAFERTRQLIPALFVAIFGDPATNPKGWTVRKLDQLMASGPQNGLYRPASDYGNGTPILRIDSFYGGEIEDPSSLRRVQVDDATIVKYQLNEDDIVINRVNSRPFLGKSATVPALAEPTVFESNMMRLSVDKRCVLPHFVIALLQSGHARAKFLASAKDAINQSSINQKDVRSLDVIAPPLEIQHQFTDRAKDLRATIAQQERMAKAADDLLASLMARLFGG